MLYLLITYTVLLTGAIWMTRIARRFFFRDKDGLRRVFNILDLQFPVSDDELTTMIANMLPGVRKAVRLHLWVDFLFMAGFYPTIALLCFMLGDKTGNGVYFFWLMGALQGVAWLCDIFENLWLLRKIRKPGPDRQFRTYSFFVYTKFILAYAGAGVTLPVAFYFWMTGDFEQATVPYAMALLAETALAVWLLGKVK
ncbi:hypothetical protein ACFOTA_19510 [Chitinophaga sp. GCM10012297]|uniref:Uncharacterized protein n=1 Tax=Chitinophaga chungangae TaxID=2821488 RepID=A0ABS3YI97_9BACT|nr:hypothetical protein [Chitinophaga chungangae]MBO9154411.1 hypothetical protein [Chitinophaga chungangae]